MRPTQSADRISNCAVLMAGVVGGVLVFVVALPLALSSPFPTPKQGEWILHNSAFDAAAPFPASSVVPPAIEPLRAEPSLATTALSHPATQLEPMTFAERWKLTIADANPIAVATPSEAPTIEVPTEATRLAPSAKPVEAAPSKRPIASIPDSVAQYLWEVYQRKPVKSDSTGDFTWKDPAAAKRLSMSLKSYVIGGMDPDFREQLYHAGHAMDADGVRWSMLSAFRDDYRQALAAGFKAHGGNSQHGGSHATGGYGHGRAVDITSAEGDSTAVWHWIDVHGTKYGLHRPMPGADPAHIQPRSTFHDLARQLREARVRLANKLSGIETEPAAGKTKVADRTEEASEGRRVRR
ncbi:MAG TPA: hypothetical protein VKP67_00545 [Xanthobacteraceae bacterium]|nr:hypothetical protein [Xanthobacteraceae bacterium]